MSEGRLLRVLVLLQAACLGLLPGNQLIPAQIGDEFSCQDPVRRPSLMLSPVCDELNSTNAARTFTGEVLTAEEVFSVDEYSSEDEGVLLGDDGYARDPDSFADEKEDRFVDEEEEENLLLSGEDVDLEGSNNSEEHASSGDVECPECRKHFKNDKSMFGYLRSHPDRGYKGATPPAKPKLLSDRNVASPGSSSPVNSRPVTRYSQRDPRLDAYEILAAYVLLTLKHRDDQATRQAPSPSHPCSKRKDESVELDVHGEESAMSNAGADAAVCDEHGSSVVEIAGDDHAVLRNEHGSSAVELAGADAVLREGRGSSAVEVPKRGRKKPKGGREAHNKKDVPSAKEKRPYNCRHCKAEFTTHQALGGHMAAHNKDKRIQAQNVQAAGEACQGKTDRSLNGHEAKSDGRQSRNGLTGKTATEAPVNGGRDDQSLSSRELLMERFSKMFNKGLQSRKKPRGYMRQHTEMKDGSSPPVAAASTADGDRRRPFDIDLNVKAPEQE